MRKQLKRSQVIGFFAQLPPCLVGMEACGGAHYWARKLTQLGHTVKLIAPQFVKPYVKTNKNDAADAEAICEAVGRPNMRFVPIKNTEQQALLGLHRARQGFVTERTAQANQIRGLLSEFGLVMPVGIRCIGSKLPEILEDAENGLSGASRALFSRLFEHFRTLDRQVDELEREINAWHRENVASQRLQAIPGIGPLTASALVASVGDARVFHNGRQFAAWLAARAAPEFLRRQNKFAGDQQARRCVPANAVDSRRALSATQSETSSRSPRGVASAGSGTAQSEYCCRCSGEQKCTHCLGAAGQ